MQPLLDTFGRLHDNLRISVTDRCNVRCFYCMPEAGVKYMPREEILSFEEIERFVRIAVSQGVTKLRLTGGEPLVRRDLPVLVSKLAAIPGVRDLALTTNGVLLTRDAEAVVNNLREAGIEIRQWRSGTLPFDDLDAPFHLAHRLGVPFQFPAVRWAQFLLKAGHILQKQIENARILP